MTAARIVCFLFILFLVPSILRGHWIQAGELEAPNGRYLLIGQQLVMFCELNKTLSYYSQQLFIEKGDGEFNATTTIVDQYTVMMNETVTSMLYNGTYYCWAGSDEMIDSKQIIVEYYPKPATNVICMYYDWDQWLLFRWDLGVEYNHPADIDVKFIYVSNERSRGALCGNQTETSCFFPEYPPYSITIRIIVNNTRANVTAYNDHEFVLKDYVKPAPCKVDLNRSSQTSSSFTLVWSHGKRVRPKIYRLMYRLDAKETWKVLYISRRLKDENTELQYQNCTVEGLSANKKYFYKLDTKPNSSTGYWSDAAEGIMETLQSAPSTGPQVTDGSFYQQPCKATGRRDVIIYWKPPGKEDQNGDITGYSVVYDGMKQIIASDFKYELDVPCDEQVVVHLKASTVVGWSSKHSEIIIPSKSQIDNTIFEDFYILIGDNSVYGVWEKSHRETTDYYIYWCEGNRLHQMCDKSIDWQHVSKNDYNVNLPGVQTVEGHLFGITATRAGINNGIHWTSCIVKNIAPTVRPRPPEVEKTSELTRRRVVWLNKRCLANDLALINGYRLIIGIVRNNKVEVQMNMTFELSVSEHTVIELRVHSNYSFQLQAMSAQGDGPLSDAVYADIKSELDYGYNIIWSFLPVVGCIIILIGVLWFKREDIHRVFRQEPIQLPKMQSPQSSPSHDLLTVKQTSHTYLTHDTTARTEESWLTSGEVSSQTISERTPSTSSNNSSNRIVHDKDKHTQADYHIQTTQEDITVTIQKDYSLFATNPSDVDVQNPGYSSRSGLFQCLPVTRIADVTQPVSFTSIGKDIDNLAYVLSTQNPVKNQRLQTTEELDDNVAETAAPKHTENVPPTLRAVAAGGVHFNMDTGFCIPGSSVWSDSAHAQSSPDDSANSYVRACCQRDFMDTSLSTAIVQPEILPSSETAQTAGQFGYVQVSDINITKL